MKKIFLVFLGGAIAAACNTKSSSENEATKDTTTNAVVAENITYPYTIDHPDNWEIGSTSNTLALLSALKAYENGNIDESLKYFGDSVHLQFDGLDKTFSNDSLKAMFTKFRGDMKSMHVKMDDWESVISKDKKQEWVTIWYRQKWEDNKGKTDSADIIDDAQLKDGKIIRLDEYTRKLH